jgi:hypothetical protein
MEKYRHSGEISLPGILLASIAGIAVAVVLGMVYEIAVIYIPVPKAHFAAAILFGIGIGSAVGWGTKVGKIRNLFIAAAYGFVCGLIGLYIAWGTDYLVRVAIPGKLQINYFSAYSPSLLLDYIKRLYENGGWVMDGGERVKGPLLGFYWTIEALLIVGVSTVCGPYLIRHLPFCENCNHWTEIKKINRKLSLDRAENLLENLVSGDLTSLMKFDLAQYRRHYLELELAHCLTCLESQYLTIYRVEETLDKKGKTNIERKILIRNMKIEADYIPLVLNAGLERT